MTKPYLPFPEIALTQHAIALGKTRSGKSSKVRIAVEWLLHYQRPVTIIDRKGDWWGLKSSADGKSSGYPIVIFGGKHADVPLHPRAGGAVAELLSGSKRSAILDLKGWSPSEATQFYIDFIAKTFQLQDGGERHIVIPEIHNFAPKGRVMSPKVGEMLHWSSTLASEGQGMGLILLLDSQRPQKVHNDVLTACETLIACRVVHAADRGAIKDWIDGNGDPKVGQEMLGELANMPRTDAWVWSPEAEFGPTRITWKMFETFDSFKPQPPHQKKLKGWADVDLEEIAGKLGAIVEEHKASDPGELRKEIARLKKELASRKPVPDQLLEIEKAAFRNAEQEAYRKGFQEGAHEMEAFYRKRHKELQTEIVGAIGDYFDLTPFQVSGATYARVEAKSVRQEHHEAKQRAVTKPPAKAVPKQNGDGDLPQSEAKLLAVVIQYGDEGVNRDQLSVLIGLKRSSRNTYLSRLKGREYIEYQGDCIVATQAGRDAMPDAEPLPTGRELQKYWRERLPSGELKVFDALLQAYPDSVSGDVLTEWTGFKRSVRNTYVSRLVSRKLAERVSGNAKATEILFS